LQDNDKLDPPPALSFRPEICFSEYLNGVLEGELDSGIPSTFAPETDLDFALDSRLYRRLNHIHDWTLAVASAIDELLGILPSTENFKNDDFDFEEFEYDEDGASDVGEFFSDPSCLEALNPHSVFKRFYSWFYWWFDVCNWANAELANFHDAIELIKLANVAKRSESFYCGRSFMTFHEQLAQLGSAISFAVVQIASFIDTYGQSKSDIESCPILDLLEPLEICHAVLAKRQICKRQLTSLMNLAEYEHLTAIDYLVKHPWLVEDNGDHGRTGKTDLFTRAEMANAVGLEKGSIGPYAKKWKSNGVKPKGNSGLKYSYTANLEILKEQFPEYEFPETLDQVLKIGTLVPKKLSDA
jgi:hypothetical protein